LLFFFQAEDGIRDFHVTGVQTCALPILASACPRPRVSALTAPTGLPLYSGGVMCRLLALHSDQPITADFWLLDAPYSLLRQSRFNADGTGLGWIAEPGPPPVAKKPGAAYASEHFRQIGAAVRSRAMIAHVRLASGTGHSDENTHPFLQDGILSAHDGVRAVTEQMK